MSIPRKYLTVFKNSNIALTACHVKQAKFSQNLVQLEEIFMTIDVKKFFDRGIAIEPLIDEYLASPFATIDLKLVIARMVSKRRVSKGSYAENKLYEWSEHFKIFFFLVSRNLDKRLQPTRNMDDVWETLVIYTAMYRELCTLLFGEGVFIDHTPADTLENGMFEEIYEKDEGNKPIFEPAKLTIDLFQKHFGISLCHEDFGLEVLMMSWPSPRIQNAAKKLADI